MVAFWRGRQRKARKAWHDEQTKEKEKKEEWKKKKALSAGQARQEKWKGEGENKKRISGKEGQGRQEKGQVILEGRTGTPDPSNVWEQGRMGPCLPACCPACHANICQCLKRKKKGRKPAPWNLLEPYKGGKGKRRRQKQ